MEGGGEKDREATQSVTNEFECQLPSMRLYRIFFSGKRQKYIYNMGNKAKDEDKTIAGNGTILCLLNNAQKLLSSL